MTLRHHVKTFVGDSWDSPIWAVVLPGGVGVNLAEDWEIDASIRERDGNLVFIFGGPDRIELGRATVTLSTGTQVTTSTVQLHMSAQDSNSLPVAVSLWDARISKGQQTYTIANGSFRTVAAVSS